MSDSPITHTFVPAMPSTILQAMEAHALQIAEANHPGYKVVQSHAQYDADHETVHVDVQMMPRNSMILVTLTGTKTSGSPNEYELKEGSQGSH